MDILRFATTGDVDDGKSTLIGRLLYDSKSICDDTLEEIISSSQKIGLDQINLALLTDGLRAEREQGITIDVAYRFFSTPRRKFIIIDSPGHIQYTRNMITGASHADLVILLIDATKGIQEQTKRHSFITSLLQIRQLVICVNKMDLIHYSQSVFDQICEDFKFIASRLELNDVTFIPLSALTGDNVVKLSHKTPWYQGPALLDFLENIYIANDKNLIDFRFPVQRVIRKGIGNTKDTRLYQGSVYSGVIRPGEEVMILPSETTTKIKKIENFDGELNEAFVGMPVTLSLQDEVDISRGDLIVQPKNQPIKSQELKSMVCWLNNIPAVSGSQWLARIGTSEYKCILEHLEYKIDINNLHRSSATRALGLNDIARIVLRLDRPAYFDSYQKNRALGCGLLIDPVSKQSVGALMFID